MQWMSKVACTVKMVAAILLIVGGLNWGLVGIFKFNLVEFLFGQQSFMTIATYTLVGIAAVILAIWLPLSACSNHKSCATGGTA